MAIGLYLRVFAVKLNSFYSGARFSWKESCVDGICYDTVLLAHKGHNLYGKENGEKNYF